MPAILFTLIVGIAARAARPAPPHTGPPAGTRPVASAATQADGMVTAITDQLWRSTDSYWHVGRYEDDIAVSYVVIHLRPRFLEPYETASWLIDSNGRHDEAEALLREATGVRPDSWDSWYELGQFLYGKRRYREAIPPLEKAVAKPDCWPKVYHTLGHAYRQVGDLNRSLAMWEKAKQKEPHDGAVEANLNRVRAMIKERH